MQPADEVLYDSGEHSPLLRSGAEDPPTAANGALPSVAIIGRIKRRLQQQGTSWPLSSMIVVNAALGAGLLNFPAAFNRAGGIAVAMAIQAAFLVMAGMSLLILAWCADIRRSCTYQETVKVLCGRVLGVICSVAIALYCYFTCVTFLVIVGDQSDRLFFDSYGHTFCLVWYMNRRFVVSALAAVIIWPLCYAKKIDVLKYASAVATFAVVYLVALIAANYFLSDVSDVHVKVRELVLSSAQHLRMRFRPDEWTDVFFVMPAICFGYQCHVSVIPVYSCLEPHDVRTFSKAVVTAMLVCVITYSTVGIFGYLTYGTDVRSDLWSSMETRGHPWITIGLAVFALKTFLTYPILAFCGRTAVESVWLELFGQYADARTEFRLRIVVSTVWFLSSVLLTIVIPDIGLVIGVLGSLAALFIFVFPGLCLIQSIFLFEGTTISRVQHYVGLFVATTFVVFGSFVFGTVLTQNLRNISSYMSGESAEKLCFDRSLVAANAAAASSYAPAQLGVDHIAKLFDLSFAFAE